MAGGNEDILGKKIFFLHPSAVIQNRIVTELVQEEFEVYTAKDETKLRRLLENYPNSIVFANISDGMAESAWETWIRGVMADSKTAGIGIGVIALGDNEALRRKYLAQLNIRCGYTVLKSDLSAAMRQLMDILRAVDAKGRRKYIRALMEGEAKTTVNFPINGTFVNGVIKDISVAGFSCAFDDDPGMTKNSLFQDIQIRLQSQLLKAEGIVFGSRVEGGIKMYVVLFTQRTDPEARSRIRKYIQARLQSKMDSELNRE